MTSEGARDGGQEHIWDYFQMEGSAHFAESRPRLTYLANQLPPGTKVLDIGVGAGVFEEVALGRGLLPYCLDPSEVAIASLRERLDLGDHAQVGYVQAIPFGDATFDAVVASEVLEHLDASTLAAGVLDIVRVLKSGGRLLVTVPAEENLAASARVCPQSGRRFHRWGHEQSFDEAKLSSLFEGLLRIDRISRRSFPAWSALNWKGRIVAATQRASQRAGFHGSNEVFVVYATKP
jgi:SAM-dependent methyltransferase